MTLDREVRGSSGDFSSDGLGGSSPGKRTRSEGLPVQRRAADPAPVPATSTPEGPAAEDPFSLHLLGGDAVVQRHGGGDVSSDTVHAAAARGIEGSGGSLPFLDQIQASFGDHDVSGVQAHVGGAATEASAAMGATAFATGNHVAFAGAPDLHTAAHEAAHVVQQKAGVSLSSGVGAVGDSYEQHADAVADRVVAGESAADLLGAGAGGVAGGAVQRKIALPVQLNKAGGDGGAGGGAGVDGGGGAEGGPGADPVAAAAAGPDAKIAKLHLFVDVDVKELGIKDLTSGRVGHTWISIEYNDVTKVPDSVEASHKALLKNGGRYADPMGFWPDTQNGVYYNPNPFNSWVDGWMRHPDRAHEGSEKAVQTWAITQAEVDAVIAYAESKRGAKYSVYFFNCTTFGAEAVKAAGKSPPANSTAGICFPNAAYDGIKANQAKGRGNTEVQDLDTGNVTTANGPDGKAG